MIVDDFFGRAWLEEFCGCSSLSEGSRLDGCKVTEFRQKMRRFYGALIDRLDPGIPVPPEVGQRAIPLQERYVLPDVQVEIDVAQVSKNGGGATTEAVGSPPTVAQEAPPSAQPIRTARKYTQRLPADAWVAHAKNCLVIGGPGSGKSTLLRYLTVEILSDNPSDTRVAPLMNLLPVWIPFAFWTKQISQNRECGLSECIRRWLSLWDQESLWPAVQSAMNDSRLLLLVDGLDEWTTLEAGAIASSMLQVFLETHPVKAIATTRPFAGVTVHGADWQSAEIAPLTTDQQSEVCRKWFTLNGTIRHPQGAIEAGVVNQQVIDFIEEVSRSRDLQELAGVPLLLMSLILIHFRRGVLPTERFAAYDQLVNYLTQEHPARRGAAALGSHDFGFAPLRESEVRAVFSYLAFAIYPESVVSAEKVLGVVETFLNDPEGLALELPNLEARRIATQFSRVAEGGSGLLIKQGSESRSFLHRSLQEFLASVHISGLSLSNQRAVVRDHVFDPRWREILLGLLWNTRRQEDVINLLEPVLVCSDTPSDEMYRAELVAEIAFGPFNCPPSKARELALDVFARIQRHEWLPHRARLLSHALQGLTSTKTRSIVRSKLPSWTYERSRWGRSAWVDALEHWPATPDTTELLFDLLNDERLDVQKSAARILVKHSSAQTLERLRSEFERTADPFRQAAILHGFNSGSPTIQLDGVIEFARRSPCAALRMEAIRGRVIRSRADSDDLHSLLELGSHASGLQLSEEISDVLARGWSNSQELKNACFGAVRSRWDDGYLDLSIAERVLLSAFPGDADAAKYACEQFSAQYPFLHLHHEAYRLLGLNFRDNPELVAAIDKWAPLQQGREPEVALAAPVGRTGVIKQVLLRNLQSWVPFWAARALIEIWGADDGEVSRELLRLAAGPAGPASAIAEYIPQVINDPDEARHRLRELLVHPDTQWHSRVLGGLRLLELQPDEKAEIAQDCIRVRTNVWGLDRYGFDSSLILGFSELESVRDLAVRALEDHEPPVLAVARAYASDPETRRIVTTLISPLPVSLRSQIIRQLARGDEDHFGVKLLEQYDRETDDELKTEASVAYHRRIVADRIDLRSASSYLSETIAAYGPDHEERRQAALAGLILLRRLDIMLERQETIGTARPVEVRLSHLSEINIPLTRVIAENWTYVKETFGQHLQARIGGPHEPTTVWEALSLVAADIPSLLHEILDYFDQHEDMSIMPGPLTFLARVRPRSELLRSRCISAIKRDAQEWSRPTALETAISILEEQFDDRQTLAAEFSVGSQPFSRDALALAVFDPDQPVVGEELAAIMSGRAVPLARAFTILYARVKPEKIADLLMRHLAMPGLLNEYNHAGLSSAIIRRLKRDPEARAAFVDALDGSHGALKMNLYRLLDSAGFATPEIIQRCLGDANSQLRAGMVECGFDVVAGAVRGVPLPLLDVAIRPE
jgi:energy-coupling factor transporter ATP-binding protein EcfA2